MKVVIVCLLLTGIIMSISNAEETEAQPAQLSRSKRLAGFGAINTVGGRVGCVVSENQSGNYSLYVNTHFTKYLDQEELQELETYKEQLAAFKEEVKQFIEQQQKEAVARQNEFRQKAFGRRGVVNEADKNASAVSSAVKQPQPPKKPSFCSEKVVTQYVFDGCSVQGGNLYIGDNFVRKLKDSELEQLEAFDKKFNDYQKAVANSLKQHVENLFGKHFGSLFEKETSATTTAGPSGSSEDGGTTELEAPKAPNFCTLIV